MPLRWTIDAEQKLVTAIAEGEVTRAEFEAYLDAVKQAGANSWRKLYDGSRSALSMGPEGLLAMGVRMRATHQTGPMGALAVIVPKETVESYGRVLGILASAERPMRIFSELAPARRWIARQARLPPPTAVSSD